MEVLTIASQQNDKVVKKLAELNTKDKFHNRSTQYKGDSVMSHKVASIPLIVVEQMMREGIWGNQERMKGLDERPSQRYVANY